MSGWRWRGGWVLAAAIVAVGAACGPSRADTTESWIPRRVLDPLNQCPTWTGRTDALLLWRDAPQSVGLFDSIGPGAGLNAVDLASGMAAGPRFTIFRHTGDLGAFEFNFFRVQDFTASRTLPVTDGEYLFAPGVLCCSEEVTTPLTTGAAALASEFQSFELNRRFPTDGRVQWLAGFRWVQWNESLGLAALTDLPGQAIDIDTATNNDLYGMQVGLDSILWRNGSRFWIEGLGKAGLFYNRSGQFTSFEQSLPPPFPAERIAGGTSTSRAAFVGELGVTGVWQVTDWLAIRTGWVAFWLGGIAQSPNQLDEQCLICQDQPITQATDTGGGVFVNGLTLGLEARW